MPLDRLTVSPGTPTVISKSSWVIGRFLSRIAVPKATDLEGQVKLGGRDIFSFKNEYVRWFEILMNAGGDS